VDIRDGLAIKEIGCWFWCESLARSQGGDRSRQRRGPQSDARQLSATCLKEKATLLYEFLSKARPVSFGEAQEPRPGSPCFPPKVTKSTEISEVNWDQVGATVSFAESGVDQLVAHWNKVLEAEQ
jgi:hypothetical protein